ncbi:MAG TPA: SAM-dependent methyltransferase, partial [Synechococcales bacterium UBA8647]|nr:SAM-dependent methyltransferase [Synechococcales bacterium UBA8647]
MSLLFTGLVLLTGLLGVGLVVWYVLPRRFRGSESVASAYDNWTQDQLLESLWGEHIHLGYYGDPSQGRDFRAAKQDFVDALAQWGGLEDLPAGIKVLDVGCGIGG